MKKFSLLGCALVLFISSHVWSQQIYPPTIRVPVTFYDFHSDGSNPEFEKTPTGAPTRLGMVAATLGPNRKPTLGPAPYWDCDIAKWFVAWKPGDFTIPNYNNPATTTCSNPITTVNYDTAFKDSVIPDTLVFTLVPGSAGVYQYYNANFFPLDGRGFGADEPNAAYRNHNYSFTMELHWAFENRAGLTFQFEGDDDVWAFINNRLVMDIGGIHNTTPGSVNVDTLGLVNRLDTLNFFYAERHVTGSDIRITTNIISAPPIGINLNRVPNTKAIGTGDSIVYSATVLDDTGGIRTDLSNLITWSISPLVPGSILPNFSPASRLLHLTSGSSNTFYGGQAYRYYVIGSVLVDPSNPTNILRKYDTVYVKPAADYRVVIEADTIIDTFAPSRLRTITMDGNTTQASAYAVVRDMYGQYTRMATNAVWASNNTAIAMAAAGASKYIGIITRMTIQNGIDTVSADELSPVQLLPDSVQVVLQNGVVDSIRLVNSVTGAVITSISMNTDSSLSVKIQVIWSTDASKTWVDGTGSWTLAPDTIKWDEAPPAQGGSWNISPKTPGVENLTIAAGAVSKTIPLIITPAPPSSVTIQLANPNDSIIAGRPFKIAVQIYNTDGLVPGSWCSSPGGATYTDLLGNGGKSAQPTIVIDGITYPLGSLTQTDSECFMNGLDTVSVTLYNAPVSLDSNHTISLFLNNKSITLPVASTTPFHVYPGPLASLALQYSNGTDMPGPDTLLYPDGAVNIYARGFDQWGNLIGPIRSSWTQDGTLHALTPPTTNQFNVYYDASNSVLNENGWIAATAPSGVTPGAFVFDSVQVIIVPRGANLSSAVTKDVNGNGYLDQIVVTLDKPVSASLNSNIPATDVSVVYTDPTSGIITNFIVQSITPVNVLNDTTSTFIVSLQDNVNASKGILEPANAIPETSWRPLISISGINGANTITNQRCKDGAAPVIWRVVVTRNDASDRTKDVVTVTFSEPIATIQGNDFLINSAIPSMVFYTWKDTAGILVPDTILLACNMAPNYPCISSFSKIIDASTVQFTMSNNMTIFNYNYFNIRIPPQISDRANTAGAGNLPDSTNQRVQAQINGVVAPLVIGPNPATPTFLKPNGGDPSIPSYPLDPSVIDFKNDPTATQFIKQHGTGTVLRITISPGDSGRVTGYLKIYDVVGNLVNQASRDGANDNLMQELTNYYGTGATKDTSGNYNYDIYWDGVNAKGMKVAPGVYHAFMYLTTYNHLGTIVNKSRQQGIVGIRR
ncbi:MAG: fibro-slime domain-containing protein [Chitinivibrionales bacterium]